MDGVKVDLGRTGITVGEGWRTMHKRWEEVESPGPYVDD